MQEGKIVLTSRDILEKEFKIDTRGYRPQEVDRFLDMIIKDYEEMNSIIRELEREKNLNKEYTAIGIMLSDSPLAYKKDLIEAQGIVEIGSIIEGINANYKICGIIRDIKTHTTKKKQTMAFLKVFDDSSEIEVTVFADAYQSSISSLKKNNIVVIEGLNKVRNEESDFIANKIYLLEEEENNV